MAVPDRAVGAIIGKGGEVISQIKSVVGVRIRISSRDEYIEGTKDRSVTITGHPPPAPPRPPGRPPARQRRTSRIQRINIAVCTLCCCRASRLAKLSKQESPD